jgi:hypothetical protein
MTCTAIRGTEVIMDNQVMLLKQGTIGCIHANTPMVFRMKFINCQIPG